MQYPAAIITVRRLTLAAILVDERDTYPTAGASVIAQAQRYFPTLPILLLSPRAGGFSRSYAHFDTTHIARDINTDEINWQQSVSPAPCSDLPF